MSSAVTPENSVDLSAIDREFDPLENSAAFPRQIENLPGRDMPSEYERASIATSINTPEEVVTQEEPQEAVSENQTEDKADEISDKWESKFRKLSEKERNIRQVQSEVAAQKREMEELKAFRDELAQNPARAIARLGIDPSQIYDEKLKDDMNRPQKELEEFKETILRELQEAKFEAKKVAIQREGDHWDFAFDKAFNSDEYSLVKAIDPEGELVRHHTVEHYKKTGKLLHPTQIMATLKAEAESLAKALEKSGYVVAKAQVAASDRAKVLATPQKKTTLTTQATDDSRRASIPFGVDDELDMERLLAKHGGG